MITSVVVVYFIEAVIFPFALEWLMVALPISSKQVESESQWSYIAVSG